MALVLGFLTVVLLLVEVLYVLFVIYWLPDRLAGTDFNSDKMAHLGNFGDAFGGVSAFFAGIGFAGIATTIYMQHKESQSRSKDLESQMSLLRESTKSQIYQNSRATLHDLTKYFMDYPEYRPYFYDGKPISKQEPDDFRQLYTMAEMFVDGMDELVQNMEYAPDATDWEAWKRYFWDVYHNSPIVQKYLEDHSDWYTKDLFTIVEGERPKVD